MDVRIISEDREFVRMCREIVSTLPDHDGNFSATTSDDGIEWDGLSIWDFDSTAHLPDGEVDPTKHLFLVHRNDLPLFRTRVEASKARILLKPVTRATLEVFLAQTWAAQQDRDAAATSLRADR